MFLRGCWWVVVQRKLGRGREVWCLWLWLLLGLRGFWLEERCTSLPTGVRICVRVRVRVRMRVSLGTVELFLAVEAALRVIT